MPISRELRDLVAASLFSALLFATATLVPLLGTPAGFFSAAPLIWLAARQGPRAALLGSTVAGALLLATLPPPVVLIYALEHAGPAWYLGWRIRAGRGIVVGSALAALAVTALVTAGALFFAARGLDPVQLLEQQLRAGLAGLDGATGGGAEPAADAPGPPNADLEELLALMRRVLPAMTLIGVFLECSLNSLLAARVLARTASAPAPAGMTGFALPEWLVWVLIPVLALCWTPQPAVATGALNALLPLLFAYLLQGLSICLHLADRARISRLGRTIFACSLLIFPWLLAVPLLFGLLDFRFGFRQRWPIA